jgi:hypothetical protein
MQTRAAVFASLAVLLCASGAEAQTDDVRERTREAREGDSAHRLSQGLAEDLGVRPQRAERLQRLYREEDLDGVERVSDFESGGDPVQVEGVRVELDEVEVTRLRFPSDDHAMRYAANVASSEPPLLVEVRGSQVLELRGDMIYDRRRTLPLREAAWSHLPAPQGEPQALTLFLTDDDYVILAADADSPLGQVVADSFQAARESEDQRIVVQGNAVDGRLNELDFHVEADEDGRSRMWVSNPGRADLVDAYMQGLQAQNDQLRSDEGLGSRFRRGAANALDGLFGG